MSLSLTDEQTLLNEIEDEYNQLLNRISIQDEIIENYKIIVKTMEDYIKFLER